jgi:hypothetical protein
MGRTSLQELTRDELIHVVLRLRRIIDVRDIEITGLERELEAARRRLGTTRHGVVGADGQTARSGGSQRLATRDTELERR